MGVVCKNHMNQFVWCWVRPDWVKLRGKRFPEGKQTCCSFPFFLTCAMRAGLRYDRGTPGTVSGRMHLVESVASLRHRTWDWANGFGYSKCRNRVPKRLMLSSTHSAHDLSCCFRVFKQISTKQSTEIWTNIGNPEQRFEVSQRNIDVFPGVRETISLIQMIHLLQSDDSSSSAWKFVNRKN